MSKSQEPETKDKQGVTEYVEDLPDHHHKLNGEGGSPSEKISLDATTTGGIGRHLGLVSTTLLIVSRIIGTGIFSTPSSITSSVGSVGAAFMLWILGFFLSLAGLFVWLELGCMYPRSGGEKVYLEEAYRRPKAIATIMFATYTVTLGFTATGCISFAANILNAVHPGSDKSANEWEKRGIALSVITFVVLMHGLTPRAGVRIMNLLAWIKVVTLLFIIVSGWGVLSGRVKSVPDPQASFRHAFRGSKKEVNPYVTALFKVIFSFAGWSNAAYVLNEVRDPVRNLKISGPLALVATGIMYILANVAYYAAATPKEVSASGVTVAAVFIGKVYGPSMERVLSVFVALSSLGNVMAVTFAHSRINQELAKEGVIPYSSFWASTFPTGAPTMGLLLHYIPSFIMLVAIPFGDAFNFIIDVEQYARSIVYLLVVVGLFVLRRRSPTVARPFRVWNFVAIFFFLGQVLVLIVPFLKPEKGKGDTHMPYWLYPIVGICVLVLGLVNWALWSKISPKLFRYRLEEGESVLEDGTVVITYSKKAV